MIVLKSVAAEQLITMLGVLKSVVAGQRSAVNDCAGVCGMRAVQSSA